MTSASDPSQSSERTPDGNDAWGQGCSREQPTWKTHFRQPGALRFTCKNLTESPTGPRRPDSLALHDRGRHPGQGGINTAGLSLCCEQHLAPRARPRNPQTSVPEPLSATCDATHHSGTCQRDGKPPAVGSATVRATGRGTGRSQIRMHAQKPIFLLSNFNETSPSENVGSPIIFN